MITEALKVLRPNAEWALNGDDYEGLVWLDKVQEKPTQEEVEAWILANAHRPATSLEITRLEAQITPRRMREALIDEEGRAWLAAKETEIQALRDSLK